MKKYRKRIQGENKIGVRVMYIIITESRRKIKKNIQSPLLYM